MAGTFNVRTGVWTQASRSAPPKPKRKRSLSDDELLAAAVADGRILASRRAHYAAELQRRPKATRKLIASLAPGSPLTDAERERLAAYVGDPTSAAGSWIRPHPRTPAGTIFNVGGRVVATASPPPVASRPAVPRRHVAAVADPPVGDDAVVPAANPRSASAPDDDWTPPAEPAKLRPGTILDERGRVQATAP